MKTKKIDSRQKLIRLIHVAKRDLGMDDDSYRAVLVKIGKKDSSSAMTVPELERTLEHMKRCGFKVHSKGKKGQPSRPLATDPESRKIRALWLLLHMLGMVKNPSEEALAAYVRRIVRADALQWLNGNQTSIMIETMKKWALRALSEQVKTLSLRVSYDIQSGRLSLSEEHFQRLHYVVRIALERRTFDPMQAAYEELTDALKKEENHERTY